MQAYFGEVINTLGKRQRLILDAFLYKNNYTNTELANFLNLPINTVTPRIFELREKGIIVEKETRHCNITGRTAKAWELNNEGGQTTLF